MNILKEAVYEAVHGEGGLVFVHGEAGIGKTRLLREVGAYAKSCGVQVLYGRCPALFRMDGVPPYIIWKEVIKDYLETCTLEHLDRVIGYYPAEVAKLVPEVNQKLRTIPQSFQISPEQEQNRLFEAVSQFITNMAREAPLLVVLDDLQWTDPSSLLLLHYLARGVQKTSLLLLGAYRSTDVDAEHPLTPVLTELNRERLQQSVSLKRMSVDDISEMIKQTLEQDDISPEFCRMIFEKTRGNPFFAEEVIKSLKEEEVICRERNKWKIKEVLKIELPETVKSVVKTRIDRLDDKCQKVLTMASLVGNEFTLEALQGVIGLEEDRLGRIVDELLRIGLLKHRVVHGEDVCSFADTIVRDVVHEEIGTFELKKLHRVVGTALEKAYAQEADEHLGELASHFLESGDKDKALNYFLKAGEKAVKVYANTEAASYLQSALRLLEQKEGEFQEKGRVLERLGDIKKLVGEYDDCLKNWNDALQPWSHLDEKEKVSRLHRKMANVLWDKKGEEERAKEHHDRALKILEAMPESAELASVYEDVAHMYYRTGDMTKASNWAEKALNLAKKLNASEVIAISYASLGTALAYAGDSKRAIECLEKGLKIALDYGYTETALRSYNNIPLALTSEENQRCLECYEKGLELAKKVGDIYARSLLGFNLAGMYFNMGEIDKAVAMSNETVALDRKTGNMFHLYASTSALGFAYQVLGEMDKSEQCFKEASSISRQLDDFQAISGGYDYLGLSHFDKGDYVKAKEFLEKLNLTLERAGDKSSQANVSQYLIWTYIELGETEKARNLIDNTYEFALQVKNKDLIASLDALKAMVLRSEKKWEESISYFEKSFQEFETLKARRWNPWGFARMGLCEYALVYLDRNQPGDREKALNLLNQALEILRKVGYKSDVEKVEARIAFIETGKVVSKPKPVDRVSTGYADLDKLLYGGIPSKCVVVLTSPSCSERDSLIKSFLGTGAKKGEFTFYLTIDPSVVKPFEEEFPSNFYFFVCNPLADAIVRDAPNVVKLKGVENLTDISIALTSAIRRLDPSLKGPRRVCIGLVSDVLLQHHVVQTRRWLTALMTELKSAGFTTLVVFDPEMHSAQDARAILDLFDGEISIYEKETEKDLRKYLRVKKMGNSRYLEDELPLKKEHS
jgi:tetratricopeptide (TPR) repeat protein/KaiC/GvpD/RAD55 family RecA-like ATPase